jgi:molecular chaperone DnaK
MPGCQHGRPLCTLRRLGQCAAPSLLSHSHAPCIAQILAQLLDDAEAYSGGEVRKAVISVPAYFTAQQREATSNAGEGACLIYHKSSESG